MSPCLIAIVRVSIVCLQETQPLRNAVQMPGQWQYQGKF
jgi:hypothetical protein